ncbi:outer membrane protein assembly factor BamA [Candidatus Cloacimonadota bacterium]
MFNRKVLLTLITIIFAFSLFGQSDFENNLILEINVSGNINIDEELIFSVLAFEVGDLLQQEDVSTSIKNLYKLGVFDDIVIDINDLEHGKSIQVEVMEFPVINSVQYIDNEKIKADKFKETINLRRGNYWAPFLENEIRHKMMDLYREKGYHLAQIEFGVIPLEGNLVDLKVNIIEGSKVVIKAIKIHGNKEVPGKKILRKLKTKKRSLFRSGKFEEEKFQNDLTLIIDYYNKLGFIDARIISWEKKLEEDRFVIDIYVFEGESFFFGNIMVSGNERFTDEIIISNFKFKDEEAFNLQKFNDQLAQVASMYHEEGYIYFNYDHELIKNGNRVDIKLNIKENTRAKIHKIHLVGNRKTKEKVIRRHLSIAPGDYYRQSRVRRTLSNIYNMGFFEPDLYPEPSPINQNGDIDLTIHLNDRISGSANGGIALNSQEGLVGQLAVSHNNLFGNSWQSSVKWEFGSDTQNFTFNFTNPYFLDSNILLGFDVYFTTKEWSTYELRTNGGSIRIGKNLNFLDFSKIIGGYSFYQKKYRILEGEEDNASETLVSLDNKGWQKTSAVSLTFSRDSRDNTLFPTTGSQFTIYNELAGGPLQGDFSYYKQILQVSWFTKTIWELTLRTKWRFGYVTGYEDKEVPPDERFYLGGTGQDGIRGYADNSVGPEEGGSRSVIFSTEYAAPLAGDQIVGLLFFDAGNCYNSLKEFDFWEMKVGAGIGIRVRSPFGLIGFDYAHNFEEHTWEPHFQFGTTF